MKEEDSKINLLAEKSPSVVTVANVAHGENLAAAPAKGVSNKTEQPVDKPKEKPTKRSLGEWVHDLGLGIGLNYVINLGASVVFADWLLHSKRPHLEKLSGNLSGLVQKILPISKEVSDKRVWGAVKGGSLLMGGTALMVVAKPIEDTKRVAVHRINKLINPSTTPDVPADAPKEAYPEIVNEPPVRSWGSVVWRRLVGWGTVLGVASALGEQRQNAIEHSVTDKIIKSAEHSSFSGVRSLAQKGWFRRYSQLASLDIFFTMITASTAWLTNGTFSVFKSDKEAASALPPTPSNAATSEMVPTEAAPLAMPDTTIAPETAKMRADSFMQQASPHAHNIESRHQASFTETIQPRRQGFDQHKPAASMVQRVTEPNAAQLAPAL